MSIDFGHYGTEVGADEYFSLRLHSECWDYASPLDRRKALIAATRILDSLNYKGCKASVAKLKENKCCCCCVGTCCCKVDNFNISEVQKAESEQYNEFPRGTDTEVPCDIVIATYELAFSLIDGRDPEMELESLGISSQGLESVRTTYARNQVPIQHIISGVPSFAAWRHVLPFLRDDQAICLIRQS